MLSSVNTQGHNALFSAPTHANSHFVPIVFRNESFDSFILWVPSSMYLVRKVIFVLARVESSQRKNYGFLFGRFDHYFRLLATRTIHVEAQVCGVDEGLLHWLHRYSCCWLLTVRQKFNWLPGTHSINLLHAKSHDATTFAIFTIRVFNCMHHGVSYYFHVFEWNITPHISLLRCECAHLAHFMFAYPFSRLMYVTCRKSRKMIHSKKVRIWTDFMRGYRFLCK